MSERGFLADAGARRSLQERLRDFHCRVHQPDDPPLFSRQPESSMRSHHWKWSDLDPLLQRLGGEIDLDAGGPRRTLRLASPGLDRGTTPTFWASIQVILPGEVAGAHRHSASAFRFILRGRGATTTVDGQRCIMNEGDLVLTPSWTWHDHVYQGQEPMVWLDVLDIPLMQTLHATFFEPHASSLQPVTAVHDQAYRQYEGGALMRPPQPGHEAGAPNPLLSYPRIMARAELKRAADAQSDPFDDVILEYRNPSDGGSAMRTMGMALQSLRPGFKGRARRNTGSKLLYVVEGEGATIVAGQRFDWREGDFFTIAPWARHEHLNPSQAQEAVLFQVNDFPALKSLGFYREQADE